MSNVTDVEAALTAAGAKGGARQKKTPRMSILIHADTYAEMLRAKSSYPARLSWNQFFLIALPRCPRCNGLLVQLPGYVACVECGKRYKLQEV